jgi:hypothetical protein
MDHAHEGFELPAIITNFPSERELLAFTIGNGTATPIQSDLMLEHKTKLFSVYGKTDAYKMLPNKIRSGAAVQAKAREITKFLNERNDGLFSDNPWYDKMSPPNVDTLATQRKGYRIKFGKFTDFLCPLARDIYGIFPEGIEDRAVLACNYWKAVAEKVPEGFGPNFQDYMVATGWVGCESLNEALQFFYVNALIDKEDRRLKTFEEAAKAVGQKGQARMVSKDEFLAGLNKCGRMFANRWWKKTVGDAKNYHGRANKKLLLNEYCQQLGLPLYSPVKDE